MNLDQNKITLDCGSRYWMHQFSLIDRYRQIVEQRIGDSLQFLSPKDGREQSIGDLSNVFVWPEPLNETGDSFWPGHAPLWDGIAYSESSGTLYLMEAKAHVREYRSSMHCIDETVRQQILDIFREEYRRYFTVETMPEHNAWTELYYQFGMRLAVYHRLKAYVEKEIKIGSTLCYKNHDKNHDRGYEKARLHPVLQVKFLLINFMQDERMNLGRCGRAKYRIDPDGFYETVPAVFMKLTGSEYPETGIEILNIDLKSET